MTQEIQRRKINLAIQTLAHLYICHKPEDFTEADSNILAAIHQHPAFEELMSKVHRIMDQVNTYGSAILPGTSRKDEPGTCPCRSCNPNAQTMIVCPTCGNKRCPHANHHDNPCTNSNEPGQAGSAY